MSSATPLLPWFPASAGSRNPAYLITAATSLRLGHHLTRRFLLHHQDGYHSRQLSRFTETWCRRSRFVRSSFLDMVADSFSAAHTSCFAYFNGKESENRIVNRGSFVLQRNRDWTTIIIAVNVMVYVAQVLSEGWLMRWGAKVNSLIDQGQLWRLVTSSCLHGNVVHLLVNSYSLNSVGPIVEQLTGSRRFLAVYISSAIACSVMSYRCCQLPAVGASGAIFGLVGAYAVFVLRHRSLIAGWKDDIQDVARMITLNMVIGLLSRGIDNWGHLGGLLGGAAMAWFIGPAWRSNHRTADGRLILVDRAPIFSFIKRLRLP